MKISIVTPSYKQLPWLKLCLASVADQQCAVFKHIIQDANTGEGLEEWVRGHSNAQLTVESDSGMYDAINRGFLKASGDIVAWLNCDEQYLPGALAKVSRYFEAHPEVDVLFGDAVLLSEEGQLLSYRRAILPSLLHTQLCHLNTLSCATFVRRSVIDRGMLLKPEWKAIADAVWVADMLKAGLKMAVLPEPIAAFTLTSENLGQSSLAFRESQRWQEQTTSPLQRRLRRWVVVTHRVRKLLHGAYALRNLSTEIYTQSNGVERRVPVACHNISYQWSRSARREGLFFAFWKALCKVGEGLTSTTTRHRRPDNTLPFSIYQPPHWPVGIRLALPFILSAVILYAEQQSGTAVVIAPMLSMVLMLVISFFLEPLHLVPYALVFATTIYWSIHYMQPFDSSCSTDWIRLTLRICGFLTAATLAMLFSKSRCEAKERLDQTIELMTAMPIPVVISDALGTVLFANDEAVQLTRLARAEVVGAPYVRLYQADQDEGSAMRDYIKFFRVASEVNGVPILTKYRVWMNTEAGGLQPVEARYICLGEGKSRYMVTVLEA